ncbi:chalcone isomerase family protein [Vreelandella sedimenti]|uniref:chalcone isomerase family protein n=1 Tax=Vreelandella sedimenti TaxID=2729618 RepID=UPI00257C3D61|nr:chalcone isomerase family protein [Halomonas sp. UBA3173]
MSTCLLGARRAVQRSLLLAGLLLTPWAMASSVTEKGETFERTIEEHGQRYSLIGSGVFRYMVWTAYAGAYYQAGETQPQPLGDVPRRLELAYFHAIDAPDFAEATTESLQKSLTAYEYSQLKADINAFNRSYQDVEPQDRYVLSWDGGVLRLALNGDTLFEGGNAELASAMFGIWLGERPLGEEFRDALLGKN